MSGTVVNVALLLCIYTQYNNNNNEQNVYGTDLHTLRQMKYYSVYVPDV